MGDNHLEKEKMVVHADQDRDLGQEQNTISQDDLGEVNAGSMEIVDLDGNSYVDVDQESDILETDDEEDFSEDSGDESDIEDNTEFPIEFIPPNRDPNPVLPGTVTSLDTRWGSKIYLIGTAHFSIESQNDVAQTIKATQPDIVVVELCKSRVHTLCLDEATLMEEAKNMSLPKIRKIIKESGLVQGLTYVLMLQMSAHVTKELGMAPGGEFRRAFQEARLVPNCKLQLGDRPIQITVKRVLGSLSCWQKIRFGWNLLTMRDPISKEDVEKLKKKDLLEEMLREITGEYPGLTRVLIHERDICLANALKEASKSAKCPTSAQYPYGCVPRVVVGVVGMGHVPGIVGVWQQDSYDISAIMKVPAPSKASLVFRWIFRATMVGALGLGCYKLCKWTYNAVS